MSVVGALHHIELQAADLDRALPEWAWLLTSLGYVEHQRWPAGASWMRGGTYVVVARASQLVPHDRRGAGLNHLALRAGDRAQVDALWREAESHGWRRLSNARYTWSIESDAESAFLESSERMKVELVVDEGASAPRTVEPAGTRHLSIVIRRDPQRVAAFARSDEHLAEWAAGLASGPLHRDGEELVVQSPMGEVRVRFAPSNDLGVLDHDVTLPDGTVVHNPLRILAHPLGSEAVFSLRRVDGVPTGAFEADAQAVSADLERLRALLERE